MAVIGTKSTLAKSSHSHHNLTSLTIALKNCAALPKFIDIQTELAKSEISTCQISP